MRRLDPDLMALLRRRPDRLTPTAAKLIVDYIRELEERCERREREARERQS